MCPAGRHLAQLQALVFAASQKATYLMSVGGAGVWVREPGPEELVRREIGPLADPCEDGRESTFERVFRKRIGVLGYEFVKVHKR